jgi:hypothetical protein
MHIPYFESLTWSSGLIIFSKLYRALLDIINNCINIREIWNYKKYFRKLWKLQRYTRSIDDDIKVPQVFHSWSHLENKGNFMVLFITSMQYIYEIIQLYFYGYWISWEAYHMPPIRLQMFVYILNTKIWKILSIVSTQYKDTPSLLTGSRRQEVDRGVAYNCCWFEIADFYVDELICTSHMRGCMVNNSLDLVENILQ